MRVAFFFAVFVGICNIKLALRSPKGEKCSQNRKNEQKVSRIEGECMDDEQFV